MTILLYSFIFCWGVVIGMLLKGLLERKRSYVGTIVVIKKDNKILYSLEMKDLPETLQFKKNALFKVKISEEESNRE